MNSDLTQDVGRINLRRCMFMELIFKYEHRYRIDK